MAPELPALPDPAGPSHDNTAQALGWLHARYPAFRFLCGPVGWLGQRWTAERINGLDPGLHTLITADLGELRGALDADDRGDESLARLYREFGDRGEIEQIPAGMKWTVVPRRSLP